MLERLGIGVRALVYLRSITNSLTVLAANDSLRIKRDLLQRPKPRRTEIAEFDAEAAESRWQRILDAKESGMELEDDDL